MNASGREKTVEASSFLVEHYWPGITERRFEAAAEKLRGRAEEMAAEGVLIRFLHSTLVLKDETAFCVFEAGSEATVQEVYARAGVPFERMVTAVQISTNGTARRRRKGGARAGQ